MPDKNSEVIQHVSPAKRLDARLTTPEEDINALKQQVTSLNCKGENGKKDFSSR